MRTLEKTDSVPEGSSRVTSLQAAVTVITWNGWTEAALPGPYRHVQPDILVGRRDRVIPSRADGPDAAILPGPS